MVLFNQLTLKNILNRQDDLGTPEVRMAVAALAEEQKSDALLFLNDNIEALAALLSGQGSLAVELVKGLLDGMPTFEPNAGAVSNTRNTSNPAMEVASSMLPKFEKFSGLVKDGFKFIEEFKMKSVGMGEAKKMATFRALGGIATASWYELKNFETWEDLEESFKKTWCIKLNPSDAIAWACQTFQREEGYIQEYIVEFEELKRFFGYMSVSTLIDMFMRNTRRAVHNRYNKLKRRELTWEQFLTEVTVIDDEESRWDTSQHKNKYEGKRCPAPDNHKMASKKQNRRLLAHAEDFKKDLKISREEHQRRVSEGLCLRCGEKGHYARDCKVQPSKAKAKDRRS